MRAESTYPKTPFQRVIRRQRRLLLGTTYFYRGELSTKFAGYLPVGDCLKQVATDRTHRALEGWLERAQVFHPNQSFTINDFKAESLRASGAAHAQIPLP